MRLRTGLSGAFNGARATITYADGIEIFSADALPPRYRQLDDEMFARIIAATGLPPAAGADHHRRNLFMATLQLAQAIKPRVPEPNTHEFAAIGKAAKELKRLCAIYVRSDPASRSTESPFYMIGPLDHLGNWAKERAVSSRKPRGKARDPNLESNIDEMIGAFRVIFASTGPDGRMMAPPTKTSAAAPFNRFLRACLMEMAGIAIRADWLRDVKRKAPSDVGK